MGGSSGTGGTTPIGTGGATGTGGAKGGSTGTGGSTGGTSGTGGAIGTGGTTGTGGSTNAAGNCLDDMQNGSETGVDCVLPLRRLPQLQRSTARIPAIPNASGCDSGTAYMCARSMVYSPEFKVAETDDFASPTNPQFVYGVVGHDKDIKGLDTESGSNACCQCHQLIFSSAYDPVTVVPTPKPMIVQAFNTGAG